MKFSNVRLLLKYYRKLWNFVRSSKGIKMDIKRYGITQFGYFEDKVR